MIYSYLRKSAEENADKSFERQRSKIKETLSLGGHSSEELELVREFTDISSGSKLLRNREAGSDLLKVLRKGDTIICSHLDRFSRNHYDLITNVEKFKRKGVNLILCDVGSVTESDSMGRIFYQVLSIVAEWYSTSLSEKQKYAKMKMKENKKYRGGFLEFGTTLCEETGKVIELEKEQKQIRDMLKLKSQGKKLREIQDEMQRLHKRKFGFSTLHKIIKRETESKKLLQVA